MQKKLVTLFQIAIFGRLALYLPKILPLKSGYPRAKTKLNGIYSKKDAISYFGTIFMVATPWGVFRVTFRGKLNPISESKSRYESRNVPIKL